MTFRHIRANGEPCGEFISTTNTLRISRYRCAGCGDVLIIM